MGPTDLFGKQQGEGKPEPPALRTGIRTLGPVAWAGLQTDGTRPDLDQLTDHQIDRHRPFIVHPVIGRLRVDGKRCKGFGRVGEKRLEIRGTDVRNPQQVKIGQDLEVMVSKGLLICNVKRKQQYGKTDI